MKKIAIADYTLREGVCNSDISLSFKERLETAKLLDKLGVDVIEAAPITDEKTDTLVLRTLCPILKNSILACPTGLSVEGVNRAWNAINSASKPRLIVSAPVSAVQMEYISHKKPAAMLEAIKTLVKEAASLCADVEFSAEDATRSDMEFLCSAIGAAIENGACTVTLCDTSAVMLPDEFTAFIGEIYAKVPQLKNINLSVECSDSLDMGTACSLAGIKAGAVQVKTSVGGTSSAGTDRVANAIMVKSNTSGICCDVDTMAMSHTVPKIERMTTSFQDKGNPFGAAPTGTAADFLLDSGADISELTSAVNQLGYDLSEDDLMKVYESFKVIAAKKQVGVKELDSIIATEANQVPPTYSLSTYVINTGNVITSTANIVLEKGGRQMQGVAIGDGPIDSAFLTIEQIIGHHYELDDFQIQAVTEGREAMGEALVKLRSGGRIFAGRGISVDIVGASIQAYINALNKIVYEEN